MCVVQTIVVCIIYFLFGFNVVGCCLFLFFCFFLFVFFGFFCFLLFFFSLINAITVITFKRRVWLLVRFIQ